MIKNQLVHTGNDAEIISLAVDLTGVFSDAFPASSLSIGLGLERTDSIGCIIGASLSPLVSMHSLSQCFQ